MINCFKDSIHVLMSVLLSTSDDDIDDHEETVVNHVDGHRNDEVREVADTKEYEGLIGGVTLRSSLRKADSNSTEAGKRVKKKVQWVDVIGKELVEIREFEPSEEDDIDDNGKTCVCVIL